MTTKNKKTKLTAFFLLLLLFTASGTRIALGVPGDDPEEGIFIILENILNAMWLIFGFLTVVVFLIAGLTYATASGDPNRVDKAQGMVKYGLIGAVVAIMSRSFVALSKTILGYEE